MPIRITGLNSGLDTESIISALVSSYNYKTQKYEKAQTKLSWKQDAWKELNTKIYSLYKNVGNLRLGSAYNMKSCTVSDATKVSVTAGANAINGSYSVQVTELAKSAYLTGAKVQEGTKSTTKLSELGYTALNGTISVKIGNETKDITVTKDNTVQDVVTKLKDIGLNASFDEANGRFFVSAKKTGSANDFELTGANTSGDTALTLLGLNTESIVDYKGMAAYADLTEDQIKEISTAKMKKANYQEAITYINAAKALNEVSDGKDANDFAMLKKLVLEDSLKDKYIDSAGDFYTKDKEGKYVDSNGNTYTEKKDADGNVVKDADGKTVYEKVSADGTVTEEVNGLEFEEAAAKYNELLEEFGFAAETEDGKLAIDDDALAEFKKQAASVTDIMNAIATDDETLLFQKLKDESDLTGKYVDSNGILYTADGDGKYTITRTKEDGTTETVKLTEEELKKENGFVSASEKYSELTRKVDLKNLIDEADSIINGTATDLPTNVSGIEYFTAKMNAGVAEQEEVLAQYKNTDKISAGMTPDEIQAFMTEADYAKDVVDGKETPEYKEGATRVKGTDAVIYVNGAQYTGNSNTFSINGMTITATGITGEYNPYDLNAVTVGVNTDTQAIYDKVKDFLSQYNALINEMTSLYNADSAKGYEPLTSEEKDAMSDTEVEKWEEKIKASLLRRDNTLSGLISTMNNAMAKGVDVNGKTYFLSNFGIQTLGFLNAAKNEQNAYHIDGDEDDVNTSGKTDKLMAAIAEDPDTVIDFMKGLTKNLYEAVDAKMKSTTLSSSYTVYNDKEMASEYSDYTSLITKWQDRLEQQEEYYYDKFAQMETALSKLNSQTSSLSGLFGM